MNNTVDGKPALLQDGARELTSEEMDLVSGGTYAPTALVPGGDPHITVAQWQKFQQSYQHSNLLLPGEAHHLAQAAIWGVAGARGGPWGATIGAAAGFISSFF
jgi:hypothetical protein